MAERLKLISTEAARPVLPRFMPTETAADILHSLRVVYQNPGDAVGLICGAPGVGKSQAVQHFASATANVRILSAVCGEGGVWNFANELCRMLDIEEPNARRLPEERRRIAEALGAESMLIIDEAQYLVQRNTRGKDDWSAFEWLRGMMEEGALSLVFCGDLTLRELQTVAPSLWRRMRRRNIILRAPKGDVEAVAARWQIADPEAVKVLFEVARKGGGALGDVVNICDEARVMAGQGAICLDHVLAAIEDLKLLPIGSAPKSRGGRA